MSNINLKIITPEGLFWHKDVTIVTVKTTEGYIGLQKNKSPFVASLDISELHINQEKDVEYKICAIAGGIVTANKSEINIITDAIEFKDKINLSRAQRALERATSLIKANENEAEHFKAQVALKKALNRIEVKRS